MIPSRRRSLCNFKEFSSVRSSWLAGCTRPLTAGAGVPVRRGRHRFARPRTGGDTWPALAGAAFASAMGGHPRRAAPGSVSRPTMQDKPLTFVIPTYRLRDVGETVAAYDEHFWRNGHAVAIVVLDDSSPANRDKYYELFYVGPAEKDQFIGSPHLPQWLSCPVWLARQRVRPPTRMPSNSSSQGSSDPARRHRH